MNNIGSDSATASFSPCPSATFGHYPTFPSTQPSSDPTILASASSHATGSSAMRASTNASHSIDPSLVQDTGYRPSSASWLDSNLQHLQQQQPPQISPLDSVIKSSILNSNRNCPSLPSLNPALNPHSPSRSSFGASPVSTSATTSGALTPTSLGSSHPPSNPSPLSNCTQAQHDITPPSTDLQASNDSVWPITLTTTPSQTPTASVTPDPSPPPPVPAQSELTHALATALDDPLHDFSLNTPLASSAPNLPSCVPAPTPIHAPSHRAAPFPGYQRTPISASLLPSLASPTAPPTDRWDQTSFSLSVAFTGAIYRLPAVDTDADQDGTAPPAFFPLQRVGFSPQLKVHSSSEPYTADSSERLVGLPLSLIGGMTLGVTGVVSIPVIDRKTMRQAKDPKTNQRKWKTQRIVVDFVTDLSHGLQTWKSDAEFATQMNHEGRSLNQFEGQAVLPPGSYILPLSMKIPASEKLPPSFACDHFRISYTMSLALWSKATDSVSGQPLHCKVFTVPFEILPSTLPSGPPKLPRLVWEDRSSNGSSAWGGMWEGFKRAISGHSPAAGSSTSPVTSTGSSAASSSSSSASTQSNTVASPTAAHPSQPAHHRKLSIASVAAQMYGGAQSSQTASSAPTPTHIVIPSLSSSSFSPASQASIPVTISIIDRPIVPTDLYIRLSLIRSIYVRDSKSDWLSEAAEYILSDEDLLEKHLREQKEISSRWGYIPYHLRPHANPLEECEVLIRDLSMPLIAEGESSWGHGYSTSLELEPSTPPKIDHHPVTGSSWFSPAFRRRPPVDKEYDRHLHVSVRFSISIEIGLARVPEQSNTPGILLHTLEEIKLRIGDEFVIPQAHTFTKPSKPRFARNGMSLTNPFANHGTPTPFMSISHRHNHSLPVNSIVNPTRSSSSIPVLRHPSSSMPPLSDNSASQHSRPGSSSRNRLHHHRSSSSLLMMMNSTHQQPEPINFPGKIRRLNCPIVIGSVAEPNLACLTIPESERRINQQTRASRSLSSSESGRRNAEYAEEEEEERRRREEMEDMRRAIEAVEPSLAGDGEAWICAPPDYLNSLKGPPAYLCS